MNSITGALQESFDRSGYKFRNVSITRLPEIQEAVGRLVRNGVISKLLHANWHFYLRENDNLPDAKTIIVVAIPQPITRLRFAWQGTTYSADVAPQFIFTDDESRAEKILKDTLELHGYSVARAHLALKTLAAGSGLAEYGRNNITYIPGMGSLFRLVAFYSDVPNEEDKWQEPQMMADCENCSLCREICPTGSISSERFLISAEKCLGSLGERNPDFAYWARLQPEYRSAFIGCMLCQSVCPANRFYLDNISEGALFREDETGLILDDTPLESLPPETRKKLNNPSDALYRRLLSNLKALIEKQSKPNNT